MKKLLIAASLFLSSHASAEIFSQPALCTGNAKEESSGNLTHFTFELNREYETSDIGIFNSHLVTIEDLDSWFGSPYKQFHGDRVPLCYVSETGADEVKCQGYGVGNGEVNFTLTIQLGKKTATGSYTIERYGQRFEFTALNPLRCTL